MSLESMLEERDHKEWFQRDLSYMDVLRHDELDFEIQRILGV